MNLITHAWLTPNVQDWIFMTLLHKIHWKGVVQGLWSSLSHKVSNLLGQNPQILQMNEPNNRMRKLEALYLNKKLPTLICSDLEAWTPTPFSSIPPLIFKTTQKLSRLKHTHTQALKQGLGHS